MKQKECFKCKQTKTLNEFYKHPDMPDGHVNKCKECNKNDVRINYANNIEAKHAYDKYRQRYSITRIMRHRYSTIKRRCDLGRSDGQPYFVTGKPYLTYAEFQKWFYEDENYKQFMSLYEKWVASGFQDKTAPSIDRIDPRKSYVLGNMQWLSKSDNCKKYNKVI
jgi:hypothetical protein